MLGCRDKRLLNANAIFPRHPQNSLRHTLLSFLPTMALKSLYANRLRHRKCTKTNSVVWQDRDTDGSRRCWPRAHLGNASRESPWGQERKGATIKRWIRQWCTRCCCFNRCPCCRRCNRSTKRRGKEGGKGRVRRRHGESITPQKYLKTHLTCHRASVCSTERIVIFSSVSAFPSPHAPVRLSRRPVTPPRCITHLVPALPQKEILKTLKLVVRCGVYALLSRTPWSGTCTIKWRPVGFCVKKLETFPLLILLYRLSSLFTQPPCEALTWELLHDCVPRHLR